MHELNFAVMIEHDERMTKAADSIIARSMCIAHVLQILYPRFLENEARVEIWSSQRANGRALLLVDNCARRVR